MQIGFYGGSFNPPHLSHFMAAVWALCTAEVDEVWMVPCFQHAFGKDLAPYDDRLTMCRLGAEQLGPHVKVSDCERELQSSYTIEVIQALSQQHPEHQFRLMIGSDIRAEIDQWHRFSELEALAPPLWIPRGGFSAENPLGFALPKISSSEVRSRLQAGKSVEGALPQPVARFIERFKCYQ